MDDDACMDACMHTYIHTFIHSYIYTFIHSYIHTFIHSYIHTFIHTYIHTYIYIYITSWFLLGYSGSSKTLTASLAASGGPTAQCPAATASPTASAVEGGQGGGSWTAKRSRWKRRRMDFWALKTMEKMRISQWSVGKSWLKPWIHRSCQVIGWEVSHWELGWVIGATKKIRAGFERAEGPMDEEEHFRRRPWSLEDSRL